MKSSVNFILLALGEEHTASFRISIRKLIKFTSCKKTVIFIWLVKKQQKFMEMLIFEIWSCNEQYSSKYGIFSFSR